MCSRKVPSFFVLCVHGTNRGVCEPLPCVMKGLQPLCMCICACHGWYSLLCADVLMCSNSASLSYRIHINASSDGVMQGYEMEAVAKIHVHAGIYIHPRSINVSINTL